MLYHIRICLCLEKLQLSWLLLSKDWGGLWGVERQILCIHLALMNVVRASLVSHKKSLQFVTKRGDHGSFIFSPRAVSHLTSRTSIKSILYLLCSNTTTKFAAQSICFILWFPWILNKMETRKRKGHCKEALSGWHLLMTSHALSH